MISKLVKIYLYLSGFYLNETENIMSNIEENIKKHIELFKEIGFNEPKDWFPIRLMDNEKEIMRQSPYYNVNIDEINNYEFKMDAVASLTKRMNLL